jgi:hypothetical protein
MAWRIRNASLLHNNDASTATAATATPPFAKADTAQRYFHRAAKLDARSVRAAPAWRDPPVAFGVIRFTEILRWSSA